MAYKWNNEKWNSLANTSLGKVNEWKVDFDNSEFMSDEYNTIVLSNAATSIAGTAETKTDFTLYESTAGKSYIIFYNKIQGNSLAAIFGNSALYKNRVPLENPLSEIINKKYTGETEYSFVLEEAN